MADLPDIINEGTTSYHDISLLDKDDVPVTPEKLRYKLMAKSSSDSTIVAKQVKDWTTVPNDTVQVEVAAADNIIGDLGDRRFLLIEVTHDGGRIITEEDEYLLKDLEGI